MGKLGYTVRKWMPLVGIYGNMMDEGIWREGLAAANQHIVACIRRPKLNLSSNYHYWDF
jgi:hypothetical protein